MKQEPVAWVDENNVLMYAPKPYQFVAFKENPDHLDDKQINWIPLYTEPQYGELSDEEIEKLYEECYLPIGANEWEFDPIIFARAILKKASEK